MKLKSLQMFRVPSLLLAAALQVLPMVRAALPAFQTAGNVLAIIFRWSAGAAAALGGVNAVSGASTTITNPKNVKGTNGVPFQLRLTTAPDQAHFWQATGLPAGLQLVGTSGQTSWKIQGTPAAIGTFNVGLTAKDQANSPASRTVTATLVLNIVAGIAPPTISAPPQSLVRTQGQTATFSVTASGTGTLGYQWRFKNANLNGQSASSLTIDPVTTNNAGSYDVIVSNSGGSVTSSVATLTVIVPATPPAITIPPTNITVIAGQPAAFAVTATGTAPLSYQWRLGGNNLAARTNSTLSFAATSTNDAGNYDVIVSNSGGSVTSSVVSLTVNVPVIPPAITNPPTNQSALVGQPARFSVGANGTAPLNFQWRFKGSNLAGETNSELNFSSVTTNNAGSYDVIVSNSGGSVTSAVVSLNVTVPVTLPYITSQPTNFTVLAGQPAGFSVQAGGAAPLGFQWRFNGSALNAETNPALNFTAASTNNAGDYDVVVTNPAGSVTSLVATLTVTLPALKPAITTQPAPQTIAEGQTATFNVAASGTAPFAYFWRKGATVISVSGSSSFSVGNAQLSDAGTYSVIVSNSAGTDISSGVTLTVNPAPVAPSIIVQPTNQTVLANGSASFTVAATGTAPLGYRWYGNGSLVGTAATLNLANVQSGNAGPYFAVVTNAYGSATSAVAVLTVTVPPQLAPPVVQINGPGSVTPNYNGQPLAIGSNYTMTAIPSSGATFVNWTGSLTANTPELNFTMQSNLVLTANFQTASTGIAFTNGTYHGLFYEAGGISLTRSGYFTATTTARGRYSAKLTLGGKRLSISGQFAADGRATNAIARRSQPALRVELAINDLDSDQILGRVDDGTWSADLIADRSVFSTRNPSPQKGSYTFVLPGTPDVIEIPAGSGFGTVSIDAAGRVKMKGTLADGSKVSQTSAIAKTGEWPLYCSLYRGGGSLLGWVTVSEQPSSDLTGQVNWSKRQSPSQVYYPMGFNFNAEIAGSRYIAPPKGQRALNVTSGIASFTGGNLSTGITNGVALQPNNSVTTLSGPSLKLKVTSAGGLFKGTVTNPSTGKRIRFQGALLQKQNHGAGFFMGSSLSGDVYFGE